MKVILFDIGGVLITDPAHDQGSRFLKKLGYKNINQEKFWKIFQKTDYAAFSNGTMSKEKRWSDFFRLLKIKDDPNRTQQKLHESFKLLSTTKIIKRIRNLKKYKLGILSDQSRPTWNFIRKKFHFLKYFSFRIISCEVKHCKHEHNLKIYKIAIKKSKVNPKDILFIDNLSRNVNNATKAGMNAIRFKNVKQLEKELKRLQIL